MKLWVLGAVLMLGECAFLSFARPIHVIWLLWKLLSGFVTL